MARLRAIELMELWEYQKQKKKISSISFQFSGGMRQRIVISSALANNAGILI